jgi:hypothetical protein
MHRRRVGHRQIRNLKRSLVILRTAVMRNMGKIPLGEILNRESRLAVKMLLGIKNRHLKEIVTKTMITFVMI